MTDKDKAFTLFFQNFAGQNCKFITNISVPIVEEDHTDSQLAAITGYLLDEDERFYYLGATTDEVNQAVAKENVMVVYSMDSMDLALSKVNPADNSEMN